MAYCLLLLLKFEAPSVTRPVEHHVLLGNEWFLCYMVRPSNWHTSRNWPDRPTRRLKAGVAKMAQGDAKPSERHLSFSPDFHVAPTHPQSLCVVNSSPWTPILKTTMDLLEDLSFPLLGFTRGNTLSVDGHHQNPFLFYIAGHSFRSYIVF